MLVPYSDSCCLVRQLLEYRNTGILSEMPASAYYSVHVALHLYTTLYLYRSGLLLAIFCASFCKVLYHWQKVQIFWWVPCSRSDSIQNHLSQPYFLRQQKNELAALPFNLASFHIAAIYLLILKNLWWKLNFTPLSFILEFFLGLDPIGLQCTCPCDTFLPSPWQLTILRNLCGWLTEKEI